MNMTAPFVWPRSELVASTDPLVVEIANLAIETLKFRDNGLPTRSISLLANLVDKMPILNPFETMAVGLTFEKIANLKEKNVQNIFLGRQALELAESARRILEAFKIIDTDRTASAVEKIWSGQLIEYDWMKAELLGYAWEKRKTCCRYIMGFLVAQTYKSGSTGSYCIDFFGPEVTAKMFRASSKAGIATVSPSPKSRAKKVVYRGGFAFDPSVLASGMSWTEDLAEAAWFADRRMSQTGDAVILSTYSRQNEVLARFEHECEVVLAPDHQRRFEVVATGELACRPFLRTV